MTKHRSHHWGTILINFVSVCHPMSFKNFERVQSEKNIFDDTDLQIFESPLGIT